jgi:hypothetical protein
VPSSSSNEQDSKAVTETVEVAPAVAAPKDNAKEPLKPREPASGMTAVLAQMSPEAQPVTARELPATSLHSSNPPSARSAAELAGMVVPGKAGDKEASFWFLAGAAFLVMAGSLFVIFLVLHRRSCQPSAITQSMYRR